MDSPILDVVVDARINLLPLLNPGQALEFRADHRDQCAIAFYHNGDPGRRYLCRDRRL